MKNRIKESFRSTALRFKEFKSPDLNSEEGSAMVIALLIMILLMGFVALAVTRTTSETMASGNDATESRTFDAANASLEIMTRNFDKIFDIKLNPDPVDLTRVQSQEPPGFPEYSFTANATQGGQAVRLTRGSQSVVMKGGAFQGLNAYQTEWQLDTTATHIATGVQVALRRKFLNNEIPIFQFGIFYDDDMEFHPGPIFNFGGRVHSNGNIFLSAGSGLYFSSKVTAHNNIFTDVGKNGKPYSTWGDQVYIRDGSGVPTRLDHTMGSVLTAPVNGSAVPNYAAPLPPAPTAYVNANWSTGLNYAGRFDGNLLANQQELKLPLKINAQINGRAVDLVELVKRGKNVDTTTGRGDLWDDGTGTVAAPNLTPVTATTKDDPITAGERYYNKTGIRISLADQQKELPGCVTSTGTAVAGCGIRLDGAPSGDGTDPSGPTVARGYQPVTMSNGYAATELNGERFYVPGRQNWIKIETVQYNATTQTYDTQDITADILSLGLTERPQDLGLNKFQVIQNNYNTNPLNPDSLSVIKLQRFYMKGNWLSATNTGAVGNTASLVAPNNFMSNNANLWTANVTYNYVEPATVASGNCNNTGNTAIKVNGGVFPNGVTVPVSWADASHSTPDRLHWRNAVVGAAATVECVVPFPIMMFDTREGLYNETATVFNRDGAYKAANGVYNVPWNGVMSMVDIDIANLKAVLSGNLDGKFPASGTAFSAANSRALRSSDIPAANGWVVYVSDRRGDRDFDGEYDMEDIFGGNDGILQLGEDINHSNSLQADYLCTVGVGGILGAQEAVKYSATGLFSNPACSGFAWGSYVSPDVASSFDHPFYRRGIRLINGSDLPGGYDTTTPSNTKGFTVASENGVYVQGNYNAVGDVTAVGSPSDPVDYAPQGARDVPASVAADAVTVLSNSWNDANSFTVPFDSSQRPVTSPTGTTTTRFAMLAGDSITTIDATPNQGGNDTRMNGGVHNFIRFLEQWSTRLNYCGSLINLYNSHNNNGAYKNGSGTVYSPPQRNWVFDSSFLDINRIPPGTPFFQQIQITGFQRINN